MPMMSFSQRIVTHPRIVSATPPSPTTPLVLAVNNQLLVGAGITNPAFLLALQACNPILLTTLFDGMAKKKNIENVDVYEVKLPAGLDIFHLTTQLRATLPASEQRKVSPNHVLIPATESHGCPYGPPSPTTAPFTIPPPVPAKEIPVTVIDSGYQWKSIAGASPAWPPNPLGGRFTEQEAQQLPPTPGPWQPGIPDVTDAQWQASTHENVSPESLPGASASRLDALAGHANFVAGVIASASPHAAITIRNHNGGFHPDSDDFPTEAAVARSLSRSTGASVINVGFAFAAFGDVISMVWDSAFQYLGPVVVVAPAGNQDSTVRRYPAALNEALPGHFPSMIGVASRTGTFSNHGHWVTCSTDGSNVVSTFLHVDQELEDGDAQQHDFTANSLASWNGTSFAAPKVTAAVCEGFALQGGQPIDAWHKLISTASHGPDLGWKLPL